MADLLFGMKVMSSCLKLSLSNIPELVSEGIKLPEIDPLTALLPELTLVRTLLQC
jgi:hypothetical protein